MGLDAWNWKGRDDFGFSFSKHKTKIRVHLKIHVDTPGRTNEVVTRSMALIYDCSGLSMANKLW